MIEKPFVNEAQAKCLERYESGDFSYILDAKDEAQWKKEIDDCGDGLLKFLLIELDSQEDCCDMSDAISRVGTAITQLQGVQNSLCWMHDALEQEHQQATASKLDTPHDSFSLSNLSNQECSMTNEFRKNVEHQIAIFALMQDEIDRRKRKDIHADVSLFLAVQNELKLDVTTQAMAIVRNATPKNDDAKYFKTIVHYEVLSEDAPFEGNLSDLAYAVSKGDMSGRFLEPTIIGLTPQQAADGLLEQGSDISFFMNLQDELDDSAETEVSAGENP